MIERLQLRNDVILVLLPPNAAERQTLSGLFVAHALPAATCYGRVVKVGPRVAEVAKGDLVAFPPSVGEEMPHGDYTLLFLREPEVSFIVSKDQPES